MDELSWGLDTRLRSDKCYYSLSYVTIHNGLRVSECTTELFRLELRSEGRRVKEVGSILQSVMESGCSRPGNFIKSIRLLLVVFATYYVNTGHGRKADWRLHS